MVDNEIIYKRELDRQRIRSTRSQGMDAMLARNKTTGDSNQDKTGLLKQGKNLDKSAKRIGKGAAQVAAGNEVSGVINIARGAKDIGSEFLGGGFLRVGIMWYFMMLAAGVKDAFDVASFEMVWWLDWILDIVVAGLLWTYLFMHDAGKKKVVGFIAPVLEILPFTGLIPWWSISVLYVGIGKMSKDK